MSGLRGDHEVDDGPGSPPDLDPTRANWIPPLFDFGPRAFTGLIILFSYMMALNALVDYVSLFETRFIIGKMTKISRSIIEIFRFLLVDLFLTTMIYIYFYWVTAAFLTTTGLAEYG